MNATRIALFVLLSSGFTDAAMIPPERVLAVFFSCSRSIDILNTVFSFEILRALMGSKRKLLLTVGVCEFVQKQNVITSTHVLSFVRLLKPVHLLFRQAWRENCVPSQHQSPSLLSSSTGAEMSSF